MLAGGLGTRLRSVVDRPAQADGARRGPPVPRLRSRPARPTPASRPPYWPSATDTRRSATISATHYRGLALRYSVEAEPLGTGGAIRLALRAGTAARRVRAEWRHLPRARLPGHAGGAHACRGQASRWRSATCPTSRATVRSRSTDDIVRGFREKGRSGPGWINAGVRTCSARALRRPASRSNGRFRFEQDVLVPQVATIRPLAFPADGNVHRHRHSRRTTPAPRTASMQAAQDIIVNRALFLDRDGVINVEKNYVHRDRGFRVSPRHLRSVPHRAGTRASSRSSSPIRPESAVATTPSSDFERLTAWMLERVQRARDRHRPRLSLPLPPDGRHRRVPARVLRSQAESRHDPAGQRAISLSNSRASVLVGDKDSDIAAGRAAGVRIQSCRLLHVDGAANAPDRLEFRRFTRSVTGFARTFGRPAPG